ncbi:hypothetical protein IQ276_024275 [Desmonostoc muscorum LEGE 12446]|uniref:Uncharacterized protein n=1 Tax=Desmonostoc muscorum LEGE 12446 TaxID=1828758 RepID=A0A8J7DE38_DESMC|nr:hypothetical protein [Desmonostoc muscorum]MCF2149489.1 hypothetical protein [Desmonostoc muscorum LEGE 12446]
MDGAIVKSSFFNFCDNDSKNIMSLVMSETSLSFKFCYGTNQRGFFSYQSAKDLGFWFNAERSQLSNRLFVFPVQLTEYFVIRFLILGDRTIRSTAASS